MKVGRENGMGQTEVIDLQERLAETRHNELLGWGAVLISALLVLTLSLISPVAATLGYGPHVPETAMTFGLSGAGIDLASGLLLLSAVLVILGVGLALYCRFVRSKLFAELRASVESAAALYQVGEEEVHDA